MLDSPSSITIRPSTEADVPAMLEIYGYHIQHGLGRFDVEPMHPEELKRRRKAMLKRRLPHLVAEVDGAVAGYAYAAPFRKRPAYRYTVEHSIYVHRNFQGRGIHGLLHALTVSRQTVGGGLPFRENAKGGNGAAPETASVHFAGRGRCSGLPGLGAGPGR